MSNRNFTIDALRIFAIIGVIIIHTHPFKSVVQIDTFLIKIAASWAVPFFFIASGYFYSMKLLQQTTNAEIWRYFSKRISVLVSLYLAWSFIYICLYKHQADFSIMNIFEKIFISGTFYHLWFLLHLIYALFIISLVHHYFRDKDRLLLAVAIILYCCGVVFTTYTSQLLPFLHFPSYLLISETKLLGLRWLYYAFPFVCLGYLFHKNLFISKSLSYILCLTSIPTLLIEVYLCPNNGTLSFSLFPLVVALFQFSLNNSKIKLLVPISSLAQYALGIYLSHVLFISPLKIGLLHISEFTYNALIVPSVFICSLILVAILKKLHWSSKLV